jgi:hypothetical protein
MIEAKIDALIAAIEANTTALTGKKSTASTSSDSTEKSSGAKRSTKADGESASKYTAEQVKAAAVKVKGELGTKKAKELIADQGADELAAMKPANYEAFIKACDKALSGGNDNSGDEDTL